MTPTSPRLGPQLTVDEQNPWPGLRAFDESAQRFFNGRREESAALRRLVMHAPLTVLFGASGLGKTSLVRALSYIDSVTNPLAAQGGADRESVDEAKQRAPYTIKSRDRAVTAEDFEMLALRASTSLARAKCVPDRSNRGEVTLVVIPKAETRGDRIDDLSRRLLPSNEVMRYVKRYLDDRRLVGTVVNVVKPRFKDLSLKITLLRRSIGTSDRLRREIEHKLRKFLHPLVGGKDGRGWEFGRPVLKSDLVHHIEEIPGVDGVDTLEMRDELRDVGVEHVRVDDDELPFLINVHIAEKVRDDIR